MPLNFPTGPSLNQLYIFNGIRWRWNGYAWSSSGICGANGAGFTGNYVMGITGGIGITVSGPDGIVEVSIRLDEPDIGTPYTPSQHIAPTIFSGDTGPARKVAFLQEDGSVSFDYIKNYDVFRKSEFQFDILSYDISGLSPQLAGDPSNDFLLIGYIATMTYNQAASAGTIKISNTNVVNYTGFPDVITLPEFKTFNFNGTHTLKYKSLTYVNNVNLPNSDFYTIQIGITGTNTDGAEVYKTKDYNLYFYNHIFYGQSQQTSITTLPSTLTPVLNGSRTFTINTTIQQDNANPYYLYYAYPARFGTAIFRDNATNIEGGFQEQPTSIEYTNANGYSEFYFVWRSEQGNLGIVSISVT